MIQAEPVIQKALAELGLEISSALYEQLRDFIRLLLAANQQTNLTAISDYQQALAKHLFDSLTVAPLTEFHRAHRVIDVGSGAGLPGIPLAIVAPAKQVVGLEATRKKVQFQSEACQRLGLTNYLPCWGRAEEWGQNPEQRETYDLVLARALAEASTLAELTLPLVKPGGWACWYKGPEYQAELLLAENSIKLLGGKLDRVIELKLPLGAGARSLVLLKKLHPTPDLYPRAAGMPKKRPLSDGF